MAATVLPNFLPALPEMFLAAAAMVLLLLGAYQRGHHVAREISWLSVIVLVVATAMVVSFGLERQVSFYGMVVVDGFGVFMKTLVLIGAGLSLVLAIRFNEREGVARFEYPVLVLLSTAGMLVMISANDLISLYLGLELQNLGLYVVASFQRDQVRSTEAGLKYFVLGALSSGMLLYGASMVYGFAGTTNFDVLAHGLRRRRRSRSVFSSASSSSSWASPSRSRPCPSICGRRTSMRGRRRQPPLSFPSPPRWRRWRSSSA